MSLENSHYDIYKINSNNDIYKKMSKESIMHDSYC